MRALYDELGEGYDATRHADPSIVERLVHHLTPRPDGRYLDLACGTGNYTIALAERGLDMVGVDVSEVMLDTARAKADTIEWRRAIATRLPFEDGCFDGAICTLAIHHFDDLAPAFAELARVLDRGRFVILTDTPEQMDGYWLNRYFPEAMARSAAQMPSLTVLEGKLHHAGFQEIATDPFDVPDDLTDLFLYAGKRRPALYLDAAVRAGISTFTRQCDADELARGLDALAADIASGAIDEVIASFAHDRGDYLFVAARK